MALKLDNSLKYADDTKHKCMHIAYSMFLFIKYFMLFCVMECISLPDKSPAGTYFQNSTLIPYVATSLLVGPHLCCYSKCIVYLEST